MVELTEMEKEGIYPHLFGKSFPLSSSLSSLQP